VRHRLPSPVRPFDTVPAHVVDAAKRAYLAVQREIEERTSIPLRPLPAEWTAWVQAQ